MVVRILSNFFGLTFILLSVKYKLVKCQGIGLIPALPPIHDTILKSLSKNLRFKNNFTQRREIPENSKSIHYPPPSSSTSAKQSAIDSGLVNEFEQRELINFIKEERDFRMKPEENFNFNGQSFYIENGIISIMLINEGNYII